MADIRTEPEISVDRAPTVVRGGRVQGVLADLVSISRTLARIAAAVERAPVARLAEPLMFANPDARASAVARSPIITGYGTVQREAEAWLALLTPSQERRWRVAAGSLGLGLQLDGLRLELAVRLRQGLHPEGVPIDVEQLSGVGLAASERGRALVETAAGGAESTVHGLLWSARQSASMVRTLNLLVVETLPDDRLD